jgi:hypothetical protein
VSGIAGTAEGAAFLVRNEPVEGGVVQYFVTAAHLFSPAVVGVRSTDSLCVRLASVHGPAIDVTGAHPVFPGGVDAGLDIAVLRITVPSTRLVPVVLSPVDPAIDAVFLIRGPGDVPAMVVERVRFRSTRLVIGDRGIADTAGLVGAPALSEQGAFGVTNSFGPNGTPIVTLLSAGRDFLNRAVPGWNDEPIVRPTFRLDRRSIEGPVLTVACDVTSRGDLEVPLPLGRSERIVGAEAQLTSRTQIRLGDLTILKLEDRNVKLRFTLTGMPRTSSSTTCPQGQTLVTINVDVLSAPRW